MAPCRIHSASWAGLGSADALSVAEDYFQLPKGSCSMVGSILGEFYLRAGRTPPRQWSRALASRSISGETCLTTLDNGPGG
jgi:hypothetical protein